MPTTKRAREWFEQDSEYFKIRFHMEQRNEIEETITLANLVREKTQKKYPHNLGMRVTITLCRDKNEMNNLTGREIAGYSNVSPNKAEIIILRPGWPNNWDGYEQLDHPFQRVLNHEYVHCPFWQERAQAKLKGGYRDKELPQWFSQGMAEYISENYLPSYEEHVRGKVQRGSFYIDRPYSWGIYIVEYLYQTFQQNQIINLVRSTISTFDKAIQRELGIIYEKLTEGWRQYLLTKFR